MSDLKRELKGYGKEVAAEATKTLVTLFIDWVRTRPLKKLLAKRAAKK